MYYIQDMSADMKTVVVMAESDVLAPEFQVLDMTGPQAKLQRIGSRFPGLANTDLAKTEYLYYPARDATPIPAFFTRPVNAVRASAAHHHAARRTVGARQLGIR